MRTILCAALLFAIVGCDTQSREGQQPNQQTGRGAEIDRGLNNQPGQPMSRPGNNNAGAGAANQQGATGADTAP